MRTPHAIAAQLAQNINSVVPFLRAMAQESFALANTPGSQQAIMDALPDFGITADEALTVYVAIHGSLVSLGHAEGLSAPDYAVFVPQEDGTVLYVAPPEPEPEPE